LRYSRVGYSPIAATPPSKIMLTLSNSFFDHFQSLVPFHSKSLASVSMRTVRFV